MKNNRGITLIALTVTIIVLIILASISIAALNGDNGIVKQATEAQIMTELSNVKEALEIYKIRNHSYGDMSDEELVEEGLLKEVFINDTYRTIGIITDLKEIEVNGKLGKSGEKQEDVEVNTLLDLYNVFGIDMADGTLYYIRNGIWCIEGNKTTYTAETGEEKEGYEIETINKQYVEDSKFITEWTVDAGTTITLPINSPKYDSANRTINITIEWGADDNKDGKLDVEQCTTTQPTHTYTEAGTYTIKISGELPFWIFSEVKSSREYVTGLKQWGKVGIRFVNFEGCTNLTGTIPNHKIEGEFALLEEANGLFGSCTKISGNIPSELFKGCEKITGFSFRMAFYECSNLTGTIPAELFKDSINATSFYLTFSGCTGLTGTIPGDLFANNVKAENFGMTFQNCTGITGTIPANLFANNTEITSFTQTFRGCKEITGAIPEGLFRNCSKVTSFCLAFANTSINEIPADIFDINNGETNGILDLSGVFEGTLISQIPAGVFDLCTEVTKLGRDVSYGGIFQDCQLIETIPDKLFYNNTKVNAFGNLFNGCINLKEIPDNTFNTTESVSMYSAFKNCRSLTKISNEVFKGLPNAVNWGSAFAICKELVEIGDEFSISDSATNLAGMFGSCEKLSKFPSQLVIPESVTNIGSMFNGCKELVTTILIKTNTAEYNGGTFDRLNQSSRVNWSSPCTEEYVDAVLEESSNTAIKGVEVTE